jgi:hypothetical protein
VIANLTQMPDGKWQALHADKIWSDNTVIGSIYHAYLREGLEQLGYRSSARASTAPSRSPAYPRRFDAFSQRREAILEKAAALGIVSAKGATAITTTRDPKLNVEDRDALKGMDRQGGVARIRRQGLLVEALARAGQGAPTARTRLPGGDRGDRRRARKARRLVRPAIRWSIAALPASPSRPPSRGRSWRSPRPSVF